MKQFLLSLYILIIDVLILYVGHDIITAVKSHFQYDTHYVLYFIPLFFVGVNTVMLVTSLIENKIIGK